MDFVLVSWIVSELLFFVLPAAVAEVLGFDRSRGSRARGSNYRPPGEILAVAVTDDSCRFESRFGRGQ